MKLNRNVFRNAAVFSFVVSVFFMAGCASGAQAKKPNALKPVYITNRAVYPFLEPAAVETPMDGLQQLEGSYGKKTFSFLIYVKADKERTELLVLNDFGAEMARITYSSNGIESSGMAAKAGLKVEYILADFQIGYYDAGRLADNLAKVGLSFTERKENDTIIREVHDGENLIIHIEKTREGLLLQNLLRGYTYSINYGK